MKTPFLMVAILFVVFAKASYADQTDLKKFTGTWKGVEAEDKLSVSFTKDRIEFRSLKTGEWYKGKFELDSSTQPKKIYITLEDGPVDEFKGKQSLGIYEFIGGKLRVAACRPGDSEGPKSFDDPRCRSATLIRD